MPSLLNTRGIFIDPQGRKRYLRVEQLAYCGFVNCIDLITNEPLTIYYRDLKSMPSIPSRFRAQHFKAVAHIFAQALNSWPVAIEVDPAPATPESFAVKLRAARQGKELYNWKDEQINEQLWKERALKLEISPTETAVIVGQQGSEKVVKILGTIQQGTNELTFEWSNFAQLELLCKQLEQRLFKPAPRFIISKLTKEQVQDLEKRYDVSFAENGDNWFLV